MQYVESIFPKRILKVAVEVEVEVEVVVAVTNWLERPFENKEIMDALKLCSRDKAPISDGFICAFFLDNWDLVKCHILSAIKNFKHAKMLKEVNLTHICLILKETNA